METNKVINTSNPFLESIFELSGSDKGHVSFKAFYGVIMTELEKKKCNEYVDEGIYFLALNELNILHKGKMKHKTFFRTDIKTDRWYPSSIEINTQLNDYFLTLKNMELPKPDLVKVQIYFWRRGSWGFDTESKQFNTKLVEPLLELLCRFNTEMKDKIEVKFQTLKALAEENEIPLSMIDTREYKKTIIRKFFKNNKKDIGEYN